MIRKNIYSRITESIIQAHRDTTLDSAMEDDGSENMGKKIVAIITADPDQDLDWDSEYEPFGATELTDEDEKEAMEHEGMESDHELCPSCGYDVDCEDDECEDDENDDMEDPMIGGGAFEDDEDDYDSMDVKDILVDILQELKGEGDEEGDTDEDSFETSDENPMFGSSDDSAEDDGEDEDEDEDEDIDGMLEPQTDWASENTDNEEDDAEGEEDYDDEEDFETPAEDGLETEDYEGMMTSPEQEEVEILDSLDNA